MPWHKIFRYNIHCKHTFRHLKLKTKDFSKFQEQYPCTFQKTACMHLTLWENGNLSRIKCLISGHTWFIRSMQWDMVATMPAVVALKVMASPLKSTAWIPCCRTKSLLIVLPLLWCDWLSIDCDSLCACTVSPPLPFCCVAGLVTNSILFCWLFTIKDRCKKGSFQQTHNQGLRQLLLMVSWGLRA